jgi:AcrR family transcriptional regulator
MGRRGRGYHHGDLRAALVAEAVCRLDAEPEADITLRGLAKAVGVSAMAPYAHFEDKAALFDAVAGAGFKALTEALDSANAVSDPPEARLAALAHAYVGFGLARPALYRLMFGHRATPASKATRAAGEEAFSRLEATVAALAGPDRPARPAAEIAWAFVHGLTRLAHDGHLEAGDPMAARIDAASRAVAELAARR